MFSKTIIYVIHSEICYSIVLLMINAVEALGFINSQILLFVPLLSIKAEPS